MLAGLAQVIVGVTGVTVTVTVAGLLVVVVEGPKNVWPVFGSMPIGGAGPVSWTSYWNVSVPTNPGFGVYVKAPVDGLRLLIVLWLGCETSASLRLVGAFG